jgi:fluoroacetyl-CoA thioesterase
VVSAEDTARALGSGDVDVLATPRLVALCEQAAAEAMRGQLATGQVSVGFRVEITHLVPVAVGSRVVATAAFERADGRRYCFNVTVTDRCGLVAAGKVVRVAVDAGAFLEKAR